MTCSVLRKWSAIGLSVMMVVGTIGCSKQQPAPTKPKGPTATKPKETAVTKPKGPAATNAKEPAATKPKGPAAAGPKYLDPAHAPKGEGWIALFDGKDLTGWHPRSTDRPMSWKVADGMMSNTSGGGTHGTDVVSDRKFDDFELYYEYRIPEGSNSGMYLRGRYEIQIFDDYGKEPSQGGNGGIWATAAPTKNASRRAGEWQSVYTKIVGKKIVTVVLNGVQVHENVEVPKPTGSQLDDNVDQPGSIMIQGDHGSVDVRVVMIRPIKG